MSTRRTPRAPVTGRQIPTAGTGAYESGESITVTATEAQNEFGSVLERAVGDRVVVITRHNAPRAVLLSIDRYNALTGAGAAVLETLSGEFDALLARMQTPTARAGMRKAFQSSAKQLGRAVVVAATARARRRSA